MLRRPFEFEARGRPLFFLLWCLGWAGVATLSLLPLAVHHGPDGGDKALHALAYAVMAAAAVTFCRDPARLALLALVAVALGGAVEIAQGYVGRSPEMLDLLADAVGAALGYLVAVAVLVCLRRPLRGDPARAG